MEGDPMTNLPEEPDDMDLIEPEVIPVDDPEDPVDPADLDPDLIVEVDDEEDISAPDPSEDT
jgi:hypothetical protein